jgi:hypothetical protein
MSQVGDAIHRFHKLLESEPFKDMSWAEALQSRMKDEHLLFGSRPASPVLRPHFITNRQYQNLVKAAESLFSAISRVQEIALLNPVLLNRMQLLPAEKMLASIDPGYPFLAVTDFLDTHLNNGSLRFTEYNSETPAGVAFGDALSNMFYDSPPMKEFRKKYSLTKLGGTKQLLQALLKAYKEFGGKNGTKKKPRIAILEFRQPFQTAAAPEHVMLAELFRKEGCETEVVSPEQLEYRNGVLRKNDFEIDLIYRKMKVNEFLVRFDLTHPLVRAYQDKKVCIVNSFRAELARKKAIFDLLTDEAVTGKFPTAERKAIREFIPWTRVVVTGKTTRFGKPIDLIDYIQQNRSKLVLKPNDDSAELAMYRGASMDDSTWEKAIKVALRTPYVVQEVTESARAPFPVLQYGNLQMKDLNVDVHPHSFLGKVYGCSSWLTTEAPSGVRSAVGLAPTFIIDSK